ncbi:MAG: CPBP family intramembrane metalloprotease [Candidatus Omnitrophica bacterium]|nr:CPBP family intramembrane metalloprotease [Candidatus Omnitrophota bacterium]
MMRALLEWIKKEKFYVILFLLVGAYLFYERVHFGSAPSEMPVSQEVIAYQQAEGELQQKVQTSGSLEVFLKDRPDLAALFGFFTSFILLALLIGLAIDIGYSINKRFRSHLVFQFHEPSFSDWRLSMLFKVVVLFFAAGLMASFILGYFRRVVFEGPSDNFYILMHTTLVDVLCFLFIWHVMNRSGGGLRDIGFRVPDGKILRELVIGWLGYLAILPAFAIVLIAVVFISEWLAQEPPLHPIINVFLEEEKRNPFLVQYSVLLAAVIGPFFEEIFFRGFCYSIIKKKWGKIWGMLASSALFAWIHESSFAFWPIFVLGLGLAYLYEKRQSLIAPMVLHITHNSVFLAYFFLTKQVLAQEAGLF